MQWVILLFGSVFRWDQRPRPNELSLTQSLQRIIADVIGNSSLISPYFFVYFWISKKVKRFLSLKLILCMQNQPMS